MINIKNRRECFFDNFLIDEENTTAEKRLHKPVRKGVILELNKPWEGRYTTFFTPIYAEEKWRMYYVTQVYRADESVQKFVCYAESDNGVDWIRPDLGIVEFEGSVHNNIILNLEMLKEFDFKTFDNMSVFYDENPNCPKYEKYKMNAWLCGHSALIVLKSADGIHFLKSQIITEDGSFDSHNRIFWSREHNKYFCYYRDHHEPGENIPFMDKSYFDKTALELFDPEKFMLREPGDADESSMIMRDIRVIESEDFVNWTPKKSINMTGNDYQLYNNVIFPYPRAPHIFVGLPLRYTERKAWTKCYDELCGKGKRLNRMYPRGLRQGLAITDGLFMTSRDGYNFIKYDEAILPPPPENPEAFVYGDGTASPALIEVPSDIPGAENEYMVMVRESFRATTGYNKLVKYTIRLDGFVSLHAGGEEKVVVTKEFTYNGENLYANIATSARGGAYFTLKCGDEQYTSCEMFGNSTNKRIRFEDDEAVKRLSGKPVTLKIEMFDCDIYSIKFDK